jgi:hypothetical protein
VADTSLADLIVKLSAEFDASGFKDLGQSIEDLEAQGMTLTEALNAIEAQLHPTGDAAGSAADQVKNLSDAAEEGSGHIEHMDFMADMLGKTFDHLVERVVELFAIREAFKKITEAVEESFIAFAHEERATEALTALTGSGAVARETIEQLKVQALQTATAFDSLLSAAQSMTAKFIDSNVSMEEIEAALRRASDAAVATGGSFESTSRIMERMALGGMAGARQLATLGVSAKELGEVLGVTEEAAAKAFRSLDVSDRLETLTFAMDKFKGLAVTTSTDLTGSWTNMKNQAEFTFAKVGELLAPLGRAFMSWASGVTSNVGSVTSSLLAVGKDIDAFAAKHPAIEAALMGMSIGFDAVTHSMSSMKAAAKDMGPTIEQLGVGEINKQKELDKIRADLLAKRNAVTYEQQKIAIDTESAHQKAMLEIQRQGYEEEEKLGQISADSNLPRLIALNAAELRITEDAITKKLALEKQSKEAEKDLTLDAQLQAAKDKVALDDIKLISRVAEEDAKSIKKIAEEWLKLQSENDTLRDHVTTAWEHIEAGVEKTDQTTIKMLTTLGALPDIAKKSATDIDPFYAAMEKLHISVDAFGNAANKNLAAFGVLLNDQRTTLSELESGWQAVSGQVTKFAKEGDFKDAEAYLTAYVAKLKELGATQGEINLKEQEALSTEIQAGVLGGQNVSNLIIQLQRLKDQQDLVTASARFWGDMYVGIEKDFKGAFQTLGSAFTQAITQAKSFGDAFKSAAQQIGSSILNTIIGQGLNLLAAKLLSMVPIFGTIAGAQIAANATAQSAIVTTSAWARETEVIGLQAVADAGAIAAYAPIPFIGQALAAEAIGVIEGMFAPLFPLAMAEGGFDVGNDAMMTMLHPKEMVLPADLATGLRNVIGTMGGADNRQSSGPYFDMRGSSFGAGLNDRSVSDMMQRALRNLKLANLGPSL